MSWVSRPSMNATSDGKVTVADCFLATHRSLRQKIAVAIHPSWFSRTRHAAARRRGKRTKTGMFLDQRENRRLIRDISAGLSVWNGFSLHGRFFSRGGARWGNAGGFRRPSRKPPSTPRAATLRLLAYRLQTTSFSPRTPLPRWPDRKPAANTLTL